MGERFCLFITSLFIIGKLEGRTLLMLIHSQRLYLKVEDLEMSSLKTLGANTSMESLSVSSWVNESPQVLKPQCDGHCSKHRWRSF